MAQEVGKVTLPRTIASKAKSQVATTGRERGTQFPADNYFDPNTSIRDARTVSTPAATMRSLFNSDGFVSSVIVSLVQMAMSGYKVSAYTTGTRTESSEGVQAANSLIASWDTVWDYTAGYADKTGMELIQQQALLEVAQTGGLGLELVLNQGRLPDRLQLIAYDTIKWKSNGKGGRFPAQSAKNPRPGQGGDIELNIPTVWVAESMKALNQIYGLSFLASGFSRLFHFDEFIEDMRKVIRTGGAPRPVLKINYAKAVQHAPAEVKSDQKLLQDYLDTMRTSVETIIGSLEPEEALILFDLVDVDSIQNSGEKADYKQMLDALSGLAASAMKSNPSVLGLRLGGSQNVASVEALLYAKVAAALHPPVAQVLSRALTLGVRLLGVDAFVVFKFLDINLRPEIELEAHKSIRQNRVLEQLSIGRITDEEAQTELGLGPLPPKAPRLSGTFFHDSKAPSSLPSPNEDVNGRQVASDQPTSAGGSDNTQRG